MVRQIIKHPPQKGTFPAAVSAGCPPACILREAMGEAIYCCKQKGKTPYLVVQNMVPQTFFSAYLTWIPDGTKSLTWLNKNMETMKIIIARQSL